MFLAKMDYLEVEEYLKKSDTIMIPVGSLENHGKHMPLGTDTMIPDKIAELLDQKTDLLIAPTINYGATDDLVGFPGTISLGTEGLIALLRTICDQFYRYGFRHFMILNGHGGNSAAIQAVAMHMYRKGAYMANLNWWLMAGQLNPEWAGGHGGAEETAGVMAVDPSLIKYEYIDLPVTGIGKLIHMYSHVYGIIGLFCDLQPVPQIIHFFVTGIVLKIMVIVV